MRIYVLWIMLAICATRIAGAQSAVISGTILIDSIERPLANAEITIPKLKLTTRSDSAGHFLLSGLPAGRNEVLVRMVGYESFTTSLVFGATQKLEADFLLRPIVTKLGAVDVKDRKKESVNVRLAEFDEHRKTQQGQFMTQEVFEKAEGRLISDVLMSRVSGLRAVATGGTDRRALASSRAPMQQPCFLQAIVNGLVVYRPDGLDKGGYKIDEMITNEVIGMEIYTVATTPLKYGGTGATCGTLVIWTK